MTRFPTCLRPASSGALVPADSRQSIFLLLLRLILNTTTLFWSTASNRVKARPRVSRRLGTLEPRGSLAPFFLIAVLALGACAANAPSDADLRSWEQETDTWHRQRLERLTSESGWLTLVGLSWLQDGANTFGSAETNDLVFPVPDAPETMGTLYLSEGSVRIEVEDLAITHAGEAVTTLTMVTDAQDEPSILHRGTLSFYAIQRGDRTAIRMKDSASPNRSNFSGIDRYAYDPGWRLEGRFEPSPEGTTLSIPNIIGQNLDESSPGTVHFDVDGQPMSLDALAGSSGTLFLVFGDETNGVATYGGGRFLYTAPPAEDGSVIVDFNRAYNPPCVFTPWATCPLPPPQNRLPLEVTVGELSYGAH